MALQDGERALQDGERALQDGERALQDGERALQDGERALQDGERALQDGERALQDGERALQDGERALQDGERALQDGERALPLPALAAPELECKICYSRYDARSRRPKLLRCGHRLCARCLRRMVALGNLSPHQLRCPFCRRHSPVPGGDVQRLQDDGEVLVLLMGRERAKKRGVPRSPEVLLCPSVLEPTPGPDCLVVTILEVPEDVAPPEGLGRLEVVRLYRAASLGALPCHSPAHKWRSWGWRAVPRFILGVLCLLYFSSLPFGIYLLLIEHHSLGIVLVSLVPSTLLLCIVYSLCQCLCREVFGFPHS